MIRGIIRDSVLKNAIILVVTSMLGGEGELPWFQLGVGADLSPKNSWYLRYRVTRILREKTWFWKLFSWLFDLSFDG